MNTSQSLYVLSSRPDLRHSHIRHRASNQSLCGALTDDWRIAQSKEKPVCKICLETLEDREYRAARREASAA